MTRWTCRICGEKHDDIPMHYGAAAPASWFMIPEAEREVRTLLSSDQCLIDGTQGYIVGNLEIPVEGCDELFSWDVWVSLSETNFKRAVQLWTTPGREAEPPYFGWLCTQLPGYPETLLLKTHVHTREVGRRPRIELEPTDHPLAVEQRTGITMDRVREIAEIVLHGAQARARDFAIEAHGEQRYGEHPYSFHLDAVAELLAPFGETAQVVGYLHDVAEDTATTIERIGEAFGDHVAACVALVTDEPGASRKERKEKTNAKLAKVGEELALALIVKAADRLANLRMSASAAGSKLEMYRKEHPAFRAAAYRPGLCDGLWEEMDAILGDGGGRA